MSNFLKALAKVGLVELDGSEKSSGAKGSSKAAQAPADEDEIERILRETQAALAASDDAATPAADSPPPAAAATPAASAPPPTSHVAPAGSLSAENSLEEI